MNTTNNIIGCTIAFGIPIAIICFVVLLISSIPTFQLRPVIEDNVLHLNITVQNDSLQINDPKPQKYETSKYFYTIYSSALFKPGNTITVINDFGQKYDFICGKDMVGEYLSVNDLNYKIYETDAKTLMYKTAEECYANRQRNTDGSWFSGWRIAYRNSIRNNVIFRPR
jgi:hypothetical protein